MVKRPRPLDEGKGHDEDEHAKAKAKPTNFARDMTLHPKGSWRGQERLQTHSVLLCLVERLLEDMFFPYALLPFMNEVFYIPSRWKILRAESMLFATN